MTFDIITVVFTTLPFLHIWKAFHKVNYCEVTLTNMSRMFYAIHVKYSLILLCKTIFLSKFINLYFLWFIFCCTWLSFTFIAQYYVRYLCKQVDAHSALVKPSTLSDLWSRDLPFLSRTLCTVCSDFESIIYQYSDFDWQSWCLVQTAVRLQARVTNVLRHQHGVVIEL